MYKKGLLISLFLLLSVILFPGTVSALEPSDIQNHWAQDYILNMLDSEVMEVKDNGMFYPEREITRGEFARALAKQQNYLPAVNNIFTDLKNYQDAGLINTMAEQNIITGYPDNTFKPSKSLTRAELITVLVKSLGIKEEQETINLEEYNPFQDVDQNHWAANNIKIAHKIDVIPNNFTDKFKPNIKVTRAEAARYLDKIDDLSGTTGYITDIYPTSNKISVNLLNGNREVFDITDQTIMGRNNRLVKIDEILKTDKVFIITENEKAKYMKAYGMVTQQDLSTEVSKLTQNVLQPEDIEQLAEGNLDMLRPKLINLAKDQLIKEGLTENEIQAILNSEWDKLEGLSKDRLSEAVAIRTGLPLVVTRGILDGDWDKIKTYAQIEVVQRLIREMLNSELIS